MADHYFPLITSIWHDDTAHLSFAARGFWMELLLCMHRSDEYGVLIVGEKRIAASDVSSIAKVLRANYNQAKSLLAELVRHKIFSVMEDGTIFCRRMVRWFATRLERQKAGALGGNPMLKKPAPIAEESAPMMPAVAQHTSNGKLSKPKVKRPHKTLKAAIKPGEREPWQTVLITDAAMRPAAVAETSPVVTEPKPIVVAQVDSESPIAHNDIPLPPSRFDAVPMGVMDFLKWYTLEGISARVTSPHHSMYAGKFAARGTGLEVATAMLNQYGVDECKAKAAHFFALAKEKGWHNPPIEWMSDRWMTLGESDKPQHEENSWKQRLREACAAARREQDADEQAYREQKLLAKAASL